MDANSITDNEGNPLLVEEAEISFLPYGSQDREKWLRERKEWAKHNDPDYYVHPIFWYKRLPWACGQGYVYAKETYRERIKERQQERLIALKSKAPFLVSSVAIGSIIGIIGYQVLKR